MCDAEELTQMEWLDRQAMLWFVGRWWWLPAWFAEIAPFPSAMLAHHYPDTPNLGDAKPQYGWKPKKHHERDVTVPRDLIDQITALPKRDHWCLVKTVNLTCTCGFSLSTASHTLQRSQPLPDAGCRGD